MEWISAFPTECMHMPSSESNSAFDLWFKIGLNKRKKYEKFPGVADVITPPFKFGGVEIISKMWFYRLLTPGQFMDNNHIDVCFYYLRKLARNSMHIPIRVTTTDCWFHALISGLYKAYNENDHDETILTSDDFLVKYLLGTTAMRAGSRWADIDHVIFPIHMTRPEHWFMLAFDVSRRRLVAYNSYQSNGTQMLEKISDICEPYIYILPILLSKCGFWKTRNDNERSSSAYMGVEECDQIELEIAKKLPEQTDRNGIKQRKTPWQDGVLGTNCPIPANTNWTYKFQLKDQIGTYNYFLTTLLQRADGGFGAFNVASRSVIDIPYPVPSDEFTLLVSDWYNVDHKKLQSILDSGSPLPRPDGLLLNGSPHDVVLTGQKGKSYKFRISNVGIATSINFRIQGHTMTLVEVEGAHTLQEVYDSLDVHVGQSIAVLVTLNNDLRDYAVIASSRFTNPIYYNTTATLHYAGSSTPASDVYPVGPTYHLHWSMKQARTIRLNLTANAARPNPQGSFHYGEIKVVDRLIVANSETKINGKTRYAANNISYVDPTTPLKIADWYNISGVFDNYTIKGNPVPQNAVLGTRIVPTELHDFVEIVFQNNENSVVSWHLDGYSSYVVGYGAGLWNSSMVRRYNLIDAIARHTYQVYPKSWTAVLVSLDNKGMWNLRSTNWARRYLGQQLYVKVWNNETSLFTENASPENMIYCGLLKKPS